MSNARIKEIENQLPERVMEIIDKVLNALDYFCWNITGDTAIECYQAHSSSSLYELVEEFCGWSVFGITEEDLKYIEDLPDDIYSLANEYVQLVIEDEVNRLVEECMEDEECRKGLEEE